MNNQLDPADGKKVVVQNGQIVSPIMEEQAARLEAARRNAVQESKGNPMPETKRATVKTILHG